MVLSAPRAHRAIDIGSLSQHLLFAAVLALKTRLLPVLGPVLIVIAFLHLLPQPGVPAVFGWFEHTLLLEFLAGIELPGVTALPDK